MEFLDGETLKHRITTAFYQLNLLFDKYFNEQVGLVDSIAERIQLLGGVSIAMAADVAEATQLERPRRGHEEVAVQLSRLDSRSARRSALIVKAFLRGNSHGRIESFNPAD